MEQFVYSHWRVLLDGVEVPFQELSLSFNTNSGSQAVISLEPDELIADISAQTIVHIFVREHNPRGDQLNDYVLFWEGMVIGYEHNKSPTARSLTLQCAGLLSVLDQFKAYALEIGPMMYSSILSGSTQFPIFVPNTDVSVNAPQVAALIELSDIMASSTTVDYSHKLISVIERTARYNVLLRQNLLRFRLAGKFAGIPDNVIGSLLSVETVSSLLAQVDVSVMSESSIMDIVQYFASIGFYSISQIPLPHTPVKTEEVATVPDVFAIPRGIQRNDFAVHPQMYSILPPPCNIIFPESLISMSVTRNKLVEPTRYLMFDPAASFLGNRNLSFFAPAEIVEKADAQTPQQLSGIPNRQSNVTNPYIQKVGETSINLLKSFTAKEFEKGLLANIQNLSSREHSFSLIGATVLSNRDEAVRDNIDLVNHFFELKQFSGASATVVATGHRWIVPGFSCVICDNDIIYHGNVVSVNFSRATNGSETTTIVMDYVRPLSQLLVKQSELAADIARVDKELRALSYGAKNQASTPPQQNTGLLQEISAKYALPIPPYFTSNVLVNLNDIDVIYNDLLGCRRLYSLAGGSLALPPLTEGFAVRRLAMLKEYLAGVNILIDTIKNRPKTIIEQETNICGREATTLAQFLSQNDLELQSLGSAASWVLRPKIVKNGWDDSIFSKIVSDASDTDGAVDAVRARFATGIPLQTAKRQEPLTQYAVKHFTKQLFDGG